MVNVSSGIGLVAPPLHATDAATGSGIAHFGDALRRELAGEGVVRGGPRRRQTIALDRDDRAAVDGVLAARRDALEQAVTDHSSL